MIERSPAVEANAEAASAEPQINPPAVVSPPDAPQPPSPPVPPSGAMPPPIPKPSENGDAKADAAQAPEAEDEAEPAPWHEMWVQVPSWMTSMVMHLALVLALAMLTGVHHLQFQGEDINVSAEPGPASGDAIEEIKGDAMDVSEELEMGPPLAPPEISELPQSAPEAGDIGPIRADLSDTKLAMRIGGSGINADPDAVGVGREGGLGNSLELRISGVHRAEQVRRGGGTPESEYAVNQALHWLAEHQNYDGSWTFEHQKSPKCHGACRDPGYAPGKVAATSLALLPFLGTGQTHREGQYRKTIDLGLKFLVRTMEMSGDMGSLHEPGGQMYGHGLASIVLCEAYGMTHDQALHDPAQAAINFIVDAQDESGGGWRYMPHTPGDTSVVGWQLMALKSAQMAYLRVPPITLRKAGYFLDHVQSEKGAVYGYLGPDRGRPATTAIGLLGRMYLGWKHDFPPLQHGVQILSQLGPSIDNTSVRNNMYFNYYATQVMHHYGGYPWQRWNTVMRDYLVRTQSRQGHERGSWYLEGADHGGPTGGRLYFTAMCAMTLEVYYRHMPLYRDDSTKTFSH